MPPIQIRPWLVMTSSNNATLFWSEEEAQALAKRLRDEGFTVEVRQGDEAVYPPPERQPGCICYPNMMAAFMCPHGHLTECHVGLDCEQAQCGHLHKYD